MADAGLAGQVALITGASSGIGDGLARELHAAGMKLVLTARRKERLTALAEELGDCEVVAADIAHPETPQKLIAQSLKRFNRLDVVFNSAGIMFAGTVEESNVDDLCQMIRVNTEAATRMAYEAVKHFQTVNRGHLINVSSILGTKVRPGTGVYAGTKHAIEALSEALRMELAQTPIKVSVIEPGLVGTELQDHFKVHPREVLGIEKPLSPADIARCVRFLLEQPPHVRIPVMMILPEGQPM